MWCSVSDSELDTFFGVSPTQWFANQWKHLQQGESPTNDEATSSAASLLSAYFCTRNLLTCHPNSGKLSFGQVCHPLEGMESFEWPDLVKMEVFELLWADTCASLYIGVGGYILHVVDLHPCLEQVFGDDIVLQHHILTHSYLFLSDT
jgi:hypothetical protein